MSISAIPNAKHPQAVEAPNAAKAYYEQKEAFAAALAEAQAAEAEAAAAEAAAAEAAAAEAAAAEESSSGSAFDFGLDGSLLSALMMSSLGTVGGDSSGSGGVSGVLSLILLMLFMNTDGNGVKSSELPPLPEGKTLGDLSDSELQDYANAAFGEVVEAAMTRLGDPYSQGKAGQGDYTDCSYLTRWAYREVGIELPRTAAAQGKHCVDNDMTISKEELQPGDLIFYSLKKNDRFMDISHVAIYAGDGKMVDASSNAGEVVYREVFDNGQVLYGRPR